MIYLDNSATTKVHDLVADEVMRVMTESYGNPSSLHGKGLEAEKSLKEARKKVLEAFPGGGSIVFTSGGTESDNMALVGAFTAGRKRSNRIITTSIEHPAVLETVKQLEKGGAEVLYVDVDRDSKLDLDALEDHISKGASVVSIMAVNNETGAMMPICHVREMIDRLYGESSDIAKNNTIKPILHSDAVQALGKEEMRNLPADLISVSGHKIHGPKGIGALYIKDGTRINASTFGGGQEKGLRSGTENTPGIAGFALAVEMAVHDLEDNRNKALMLNKELRKGIQSEIKDIRFNSPEDGCPSILNVSFLGTRGEVILHTLEQSGIMVSTGSACSSGKNAHKSGSHVLKAMGLSKEEVEGAIRFSFGAYNTIDEIPIVVDKLKSAVEGFRRLGSFR